MLGKPLFRNTANMFVKQTKHDLWLYPHENLKLYELLENASASLNKFCFLLYKTVFTNFSTNLTISLVISD